MLMLRAIYFAQEEEHNETLETMRYMSRVAGSMGATIDPTMSFGDTTDADEEIVYARDPFAAGMAMDFSTENESESNGSVDLKEFPWATGIDVEARA